VRVLLGLLKGGIIGGGLGFGFHTLGLSGIGFLHYLLYGVIGALVGFIAGRPFWKHDTLWTPVVKSVVGFILCLGLYALAKWAMGDIKLSFIGPNVTATSLPYLFGAAVGVVYGVFVEVDDGGKPAESKQAETEKKAQQQS
jgi:hypothetical protein